MNRNSVKICQRRRKNGERASHEQQAGVPSEGCPIALVIDILAKSKYNQS
jgi:hypothetical protein